MNLELSLDEPLHENEMFTSAREVLTSVLPHFYYISTSTRPSDACPNNLILSQNENTTTDKKSLS